MIFIALKMKRKPEIIEKKLVFFRIFFLNFTYVGKQYFSPSQEGNGSILLPVYCLGRRDRSKRCGGQNPQNLTERVSQRSCGTHRSQGIAELCGTCGTSRSTSQNPQILTERVSQRPCGTHRISRNSLRNFRNLP